MIYLWLAIGCSALIALILKHAENRDMNRFAVLSANYLTASVISLGLWWLSPSTVTGVQLKAGWAELGARLAGHSQTTTPVASMIWSIIVGLAAGGLFFFSFLYYQKAVRHHGVALAGAFAKLGFLLPMLLSMFMWREFPDQWQWIAIGLALFALALVNWPTGQSWRQALQPLLLLLCGFGGLAEFSNKVFQKFGLQVHKPVFLLATFATALCFSLVATFRHGQPIYLREWRTGLAVGIPNLFSSYFLIQALATLPAAVAYPLFGAGTIAIIYLAGMVLYHERPQPREVLAIGLILIAMVFH